MGDHGFMEVLASLLFLFRVKRFANSRTFADVGARVPCLEAKQDEDQRVASSMNKIFPPVISVEQPSLVNFPVGLLNFWFPLRSGQLKRRERELSQTSFERKRENREGFRRKKMVP